MKRDYYFDFLAHHDGVGHVVVRTGYQHQTHSGIGQVAVVHVQVAFRRDGGQTHRHPVVYLRSSAATVDDGKEGVDVCTGEVVVRVVDGDHVVRGQQDLQAV